MVRWRLSGQFRPMAEVTRAGSNGFDVTPAFHPPATRDGPLLSRRSTGEATGGFKPARCLSSWAAVDRYLIGSTVCKTSQSFASLRGGGAFSVSPRLRACRHSDSACQRAVGGQNKLLGLEPDVQGRELRRSLGTADSSSFTGSRALDRSLDRQQLGDPHHTLCRDRRWVLPRMLVNLRRASDKDLEDNVTCYGR